MTKSELIQELRNCCIDYYNNYAKGYRESSKEYRGNKGSMKFWKDVFDREDEIIQKTTDKLFKEINES